jgi:hypothetical protein
MRCILFKGGKVQGLCAGKAFSVLLREEMYRDDLHEGDAVYHAIKGGSREGCRGRVQCAVQGRNVQVRCVQEHLSRKEVLCTEQVRGWSACYQPLSKMTPKKTPFLKNLKIFHIFLVL